MEDRDRLQHRSERAWKAAELAPITPHTARHSFASIAIAAEVQPKALQVFMGHTRVDWRVAMQAAAIKDGIKMPPWVLKVGTR